MPTWISGLQGDLGGAGTWTLGSLKLFPRYGLAQRYGDDLLKTRIRRTFGGTTRSFA